MKKLNLGMKIGGGFGLILALFIFVAVVAWGGISGMLKGFITYRGLAEETNLAGSLQADMLMARINAKDFIIKGSHKNLEQYKRYLNKMHTSLQQTQAVAQSSQRAASIDFISQKVDEYRAAFDKVITAKTERNGMVDETISANLDRIGADIAAAVEEIKLSVKSKQEGLGPQLQAKSHRSEAEVLIVSLIALVAGSVMAILITLAIARPVSKAVAFADRLADGDLTQTLEVSQQDEIGKLASALNNMASSLKTLFGELKSGVDSMSNAATELSAISQQMSAGAEQTSSKANTVATSAEEMSANVGNVAAAMEQAATNLNMVATATDEMTTSVEEIAQNSEKARDITTQAVTKAGDTSKKVDNLGSAAEAIGKVTETIAEISEQTNLLALNATIEAARAGDAGKGFAVVANEIKELAKQTADATTEIKNKIEGVQTSTRETVNEIGSITEVIGKVDEVVGSIATAVEEQSVTTRDIAANISQASRGVDEASTNAGKNRGKVAAISEAIGEVSQASGEMTTSSSQVNMSAEELSGLAEKINAMVARFRI
jgi:methyl-accepting chemotaxis protein